MKTNFKKKLLLSTGIIVASVILAVGALVYLSNNLNANAASLMNDRAAMQDKTSDLARLADLEHDAPLAATYQAAIGQLLPPAAGLINVPPAVAALATADGVTATFSFEGNPSAAAGDTIGTVPFSLSVQGTLDHVTSFLADLETKTNSFLVNVDSFDVANSGAGGEVTLTGQGTLYFQ